MKRLSRRRTAAAALALVVAVSLLLVAPGSAARIELAAGGSLAFAHGAERCTDGPVTVTPSGTPQGGTFTEVTVSGITGDCAGGNVSVLEAQGLFHVLFSGAGTVSGSTMTVTSAPFTPPATALGAVVVGLDGWVVPAVWEYEPPADQGPITPGDNVELVGEPAWDVTGVGNQFCVTTTVRGTSATPSPWTLDLHVMQRPFNGRTTVDSNFQLGTWEGYEWVSTTAVDGLLQVRGVGGKATITSGQQFTITLCEYGSPVPSYDPDLSYTMTTWLTGNSNWACLHVTVGVTGAAPFYAGWRADVDLTPLWDLVGSQFPPANIHGTGGEYASEHLSGPVYRVSGTNWNSSRIRDDRPVTFQICGG